MQPTEAKPKERHMRIAKLIGAMFVVLAFSAVAVATASAEETLWKWLPGSVGETFKGSSEKATLQESGLLGGLGIAITCTKSLLLLTDAELKVSSELLAEGATEGKDATLGLGILHFEGCLVANLAANSVGDKAGIILVHLEAHNCLIKKGEFGLLIKPLPLTIEVAAAKLKIEVRGDFVALLEGKEGTKALTYKLKIEQKEGNQKIEKCENGVKETLESNTDANGFHNAGEEAKNGTLEFDMTKDKEGEEPMEK
jgi:hypothetical protein